MNSGNIPHVALEEQPLPASYPRDAVAVRGLSRRAQSPSYTDVYDRLPFPTLALDRCTVMQCGKTASLQDMHARREWSMTPRAAGSLAPVRLLVA